MLYPGLIDAVAGVSSAIMCIRIYLCVHDVVDSDTGTVLERRYRYCSNYRTLPCFPTTIRDSGSSDTKCCVFVAVVVTARVARGDCCAPGAQRSMTEVSNIRATAHLLCFFSSLRQAVICRNFSILSADRSLPASDAIGL